MKRYKDTIITVILWIIGICLASVAIYMYVSYKPNVKTLYINTKDIVLDDGEKSGTTETGYASETSYSGESYVPSSMFEYPFRKSSSYIPNKEYINMIGEENARIVSERMRTAMETLFTVNYGTIEDETYRDTLNQYLMDGMEVYFNDNTDVIGLDEISETFIEKIKNEEIIMEARGYSDKCMVFRDGFSETVRVKLVLAVYGCKDVGKLDEFMGVENIEIGKPFSVIYDVQTSPTTITDDRSENVVVSMDKIN